MKMLLGALAAVTVLVGVAAAQPAEARCFWNGFAMECYRPYGYGPQWGGWGWHHHPYAPYYAPAPFYRGW